MSTSRVDVQELIAWELDEYPFRESAKIFEETMFKDKVRHARQKLAARAAYNNDSALLAEETKRIRPLLAIAAQQTDLHDEYNGLEWELSVIDLRYLLAFQRRLVFSSARTSVAPQQHDWPQLVALAFGPQRSTQHSVTQNKDTDALTDISLYSSNPDLQIRFTTKTKYGDSLPFILYGGSPYFEVAELQGRWFLRDGYHRAYHLLRAGVYRVPAVVIRARTIEELGATEPWFFSNDQLFSDRPPQIMDFLDDDMIFCYERMALRKTIRIRIEESLEPWNQPDEVEGEKL